MVAVDFIVGIIGNVVSILSFASPIGSFKEMIKKKSADNYDGIPYITTLLSTSLWNFYGAMDPDDGVLIVIVNAVGVASQLMYLTLFLIYSSKDRKVKYLGFMVLDIVFLGLVVAITLTVFRGGGRRTFMGVLCATFTIVMYASPLKAMKKVVETMCVEYMPFLPSFSLFLNAAVWFTFAALLKDCYVLVPNAVGILFGSSQLIVYFLYKNAPSSSSKQTKTAVEEISINMTKKSIKIEEDDKSEEKAQKNDPDNGRSLSLQNPSVSRQYSSERIFIPISEERDFENGEGDEEKTQKNDPNSGRSLSLRNPSVSRQYSFKRIFIPVSGERF